MVRIGADDPGPLIRRHYDRREFDSVAALASPLLEEQAVLLGALALY